MNKKNPNLNEPKKQKFRLARAYVPYQKLHKVYKPDEALLKGTMFPELYDPYNPCR